MRPLNDTTGKRKCQTFFCEKTGKNDEKTAVCGHVRAKCRLCRRIRGEAPSENTLRTGRFEKPLKHRFEKTFGKHLTNTRAPAIICTASGRLAQLVEHPLDVRKVAGSSPTSSTIHPASSEAGFSSFVGEKLAFCLLFSVLFNFSVYFSVRFAGP